MVNDDKGTAKKSLGVLLIAGGGAVISSCPLWIAFTIGLELICLGGLILD